VARGPIRRAQLIAPFGVGAMVVVRDGTSVISCGLDHWYERETGREDTRNLNPAEFQIEEWRLQQTLGVNHFRLPPDFREPQRGEHIPNNNISVPFLRFPKWHFCPGCYRLTDQPAGARGHIPCNDCLPLGRKRYLAQVPFVAMCENGHIQDFPWREWAHRSINPSCQQPIRLIATGGASLAAQKVACDCGSGERTLAQITQATDTGTFLSASLDRGRQPYLCRGECPWLDNVSPLGCGASIRGSLRSASNVYFADVKSSIYIPRGNNAVPPELMIALEEPPLSTLIRLLIGAGAKKISPADLRGVHTSILQPFTDAEIAAGIKIVMSGYQPGEAQRIEVTGDDPITAFRRAEFNVLRTPRSEQQLAVRPADLAEYDDQMVKFFSKIMLAERIKETRVLAGFTRIFPDNPQTLDQRKALLWRTVPPVPQSWLPAYVVYGEGIFLELDEHRLSAWEQRVDVIRRLDLLNQRYQGVQSARRLRQRNLTPRFLLSHTLAHLIMNRLTFECGYSSASLRERLYVSANSSAPMAGILIYTAAGDAEGTMGGLVRMGKAGYFEPMLRRAIETAGWCSADPVCMEIGGQSGQGPDSCNLAACHSCALVPETACEEFNRFLDRGVLIGDLGNRALGYFNN